MLFEALRLALALALLVVLPGWLLLFALFPRSAELTFAARVYVVLAGGVLVLMFIGVVLGFLPHAGNRGHLQSLALGGMPNVELAVLGVCALFGWIGVHRGAYPALERWIPKRLRGRTSTPPQGPGS